MAELTVPQIDFSTLGQLPEIYRQNQANQLRQQTLANLGQGGTADATALLKSGDLSLAQLGINLRNRQEDQTRQAQQDVRQTGRDSVADAHQKFMEGIALRSANRADEGVPEKAADRAKAAANYGLTPDMPEFKSFVLTGTLPAPNQGIPSGYQRGADGSLTFIKGGPQDPDIIKGQADAWQGTGNIPKTVSPGAAIVRPGTGEVLYKNSPESNLDGDTIKTMAEQARAGDTSVFQNMGRGAQGAENIVRLRQEIAKQNADAGVSGAEQALRNAEMMGVKAGQRAIGTKGANIEMAATEFNQVIPVVQAASKAVSRTNYPDLNKIILAYNEKTGDPNVVKFGGGVNTLVNLYARAISPTGVATVSDKDHAREILNKAWSGGQFDAAVGMMQQEIEAALRSPEKVRDEMRKRFLNGQGAAPVGYPAPGGPSPQGGGADAMLQQARDAIAQGAPKAAVLQRLQQAGVDASGL
jgi:hypothetical protein